MTTIMITNNEGKIHDNDDIKMMTVNTKINNMSWLRRVLKDVNMVLVVLSPFHSIFLRWNVYGIIVHIYNPQKEIQKQ